jgi:2-polyprenyl-6-methoxyphenol hydroxylase-like FAD-dependent oxidoreductase
MKAYFITNIMGENMKVAIVGGGAAGLLQALMLQQKGVDVEVFEKLKERPSFKRIVGLDFRSLRTLKDLKILDEVIEIGYKISSAFIFENDQLIASLYMDKVKTDVPFLLTISLSDFETLLESKIRKLNKGVSLTEIHKKGGAQVLNFDDGQSFEYDLVIGADGPKSFVRNLMKIPSSYYQYPFSLEVSNQRVDEQEERVQMYFEKGRTCHVRFPHSKDHVQVIRVLSDKLPSIDKVKTIKGENESEFEVKLDKSLAKTFYKEGVLLLGDAAHHMTPFGGRALNLTVEDAKQYAQAIAGGTIEAVAKIRRARAKRVILETHFLAKFVSRGSKWVLRGFKFLNNHPVIFSKMLRMHLNITKGN